MPAFKAELDEFVTAIREDRSPAVGFADGRAALVLAEAANESVATGTGRQGRLIPTTSERPVRSRGGAGSRQRCSRGA